MSNLARKQQHDPQVSETFGTVIRSEQGALVVETETREVRARRATSCLLEPVPGDLVLIAAMDGARRPTCSRCSSARRGSGDPRRRWGSRHQAAFWLLWRGGRRGRAHGGAQRGDGGLRRGPRQRRRGERRARAPLFLSKFIRAEVGRAKIFGETVDSVLDRVSQRLKRSYRVVEECDHVRAEQIDYAAKKRLSLHGEHALVTAQHLAKIEGDQIHLG